MARDHAQIRLNIWSDDDFRTLSGNAQHLYFLLLTSPGLSYCGVADWRPARMTGLVGDWTVDTIQAAADELIARLYILIDEATEEVLVRSFVRHDGLMKQPKMATAMSTAHMAVGSVALRGVIVWELQRLQREQPDLHGWGSDKAAALLSMASVDPSTYPCGKGSSKGSGKGKANPSTKGSGEGSPTPNSLLLTPAPTPETSSPARKRAETPAPENFVIDAGLREWATKKGITVNLDEETEAFLDHHAARGNTFSDWRRAWQTWMRNTSKYAPNNVRAIRPNDPHAGKVRCRQTESGRWRQVYDDEVLYGIHTEWRSVDDL